MRSLFLFLTAAVLFAACGTGSDSTPLRQPEKTSTYCTYTFDPEQTEIRWTAYKFTERVGVGGVFDAFEIQGTRKAEDVRSVFSEATFSIPVASINSENPDRDQKIRTYFFGNIGTERIEGKLVSWQEDGNAQFSIILNGVEKTVTGTYEVDNQQRITLTADIDVSDWNGMPGITALNDICDDLHIGEDGISKLWPDVKVEIISRVVPNCR